MFSADRKSTVDGESSVNKHGLMSIQESTRNALQGRKLTIDDVDRADASPEAILADARKDAKVNMFLNSQRKKAMHTISIDGTAIYSGAHETDTRAQTFKQPSPLGQTVRQHDQSLYSEGDGMTMMQGSIRENEATQMRAGQKTIHAGATPLRLFENKAARS